MSDWKMEVVTNWRVGAVYLDRDGERYECVKVLEGSRPLFVSVRKSGEEITVARTPSGKIHDGELMTGDIVGEETAAERKPRVLFAAEWDVPGGGTGLVLNAFASLEGFDEHRKGLPAWGTYRPVRFVEDLGWRPE